jgi:serine/threonine-protein kinase
MSPLDKIALDALRPVLQANGSGEEQLLRWWKSTAPAGLGLLDFLVDQQVFSADVTKTFQMVLKGYLDLTGMTVIQPKMVPVLVKKMAGGSPTADGHVLQKQTTKGFSPRERTVPEGPRTLNLETQHSIVVPVTPKAEAEASEQYQIGDRVGRCLLTRLLGRGGGGIVYEAMHQGLGIPVAVKLLPPGKTSPSVLKTLTREARTLAMLQHRNVIRVLDFDPDAPTPYLIMELASGLSLAELIGQSGWLRTEQAVNVITQAACGLDAGWRAGFIHRDVKPANILIDRGGEVKIADLGLATRRNDIEESAHGAGEKAKACGTVAYMAPECFDTNSAPDLRSDIYSLGITFYEALTGTLPYEGTNGFEYMIQHATAPVPDPRRINPMIPPAISGLIGMMMAKNPSDRFDSYEPLLAELRGYYAPPGPVAVASTLRQSVAV